VRKSTRRWLLKIIKTTTVSVASLIFVSNFNFFGETIKKVILLVNGAAPLKKSL
jgi:hypothetical protein